MNYGKKFEALRRSRLPAELSSVEADLVLAKASDNELLVLAAGLCVEDGGLVPQPSDGVCYCSPTLRVVKSNGEVRSVSRAKQAQQKN